MNRKSAKVEIWNECPWDMGYHGLWVDREFNSLEDYRNWSWNASGPADSQWISKFFVEGREVSYEEFERYLKS